jgi:hypothetical protein
VSKARPVRKSDNLAPPFVSRLSTQCGILNVSQSYRPPRPVTKIALLCSFFAKRSPPITGFPLTCRAVFFPFMVRNEYQRQIKEYFCRVERSRCVMLSRQCGIPNISQPHGPPRLLIFTFGFINPDDPCNWSALARLFSIVYNHHRSSVCLSVCLSVCFTVFHRTAHLNWSQ